jgi:hypothetical protein
VPSAFVVAKLCQSDRGAECPSLLSSRSCQESGCNVGHAISRRYQQSVRNWHCWRPRSTRQVPGIHQRQGGIEQRQQHESVADILSDKITVLGKYRPTSLSIVQSRSLTNQPLPGVVYTQGGGWILGRYSCPWYSRSDEL